MNLVNFQDFFNKLYTNYYVLNIKEIPAYKQDFRSLRHTFAHNVNVEIFLTS